LIKLSEYFQCSRKRAIVGFLADKVLYEVGDEEMALEALQMAEERAAYLAFQKIDRNEVLKKIQEGIGKFKQVKRHGFMDPFQGKMMVPIAMWTSLFKQMQVSRTLIW
jgi:hypothetical protein